MERSKEKLYWSIGVAAFIGLRVWVVSHRPPLTPAQQAEKAKAIKEFEDEENMFPGPQ